MSPLRRAVQRAAGPVSLIGAVAGFVGDVIQPLGNFAPWVALGSLAGAAILFVMFMSLRRRQGEAAWDTPVAGLLVLCALSTLIFSLWAVVFAAGPERGYLADNFEPVARLQAQLLGLQEDVTAIKETTTKTATVVAVSATSQAQGFAEVQAAFAALAGQGALVKDPKTPQEWYSNARLYSLRGDTANAIKAYEGYFAFNLEYVDPFFEYSALLRASEGIARTRQIAADMLNARPDSQARSLAWIRLLDAPQERLQRLMALAARAPQYGPVFDELGQEYDRALAATVTSDLLKKQADAYGTLLRLEEQQALSRYYIDKALADKRVESARRMLAAFAGAVSAFGRVEVQVYYYFNGVQFIVVLPEVQNAKQLLFGIDEPQPKTDAGRTGAGAQTFVNTSIGPLPLPLGDHTFFVQYVDANGVPSQVFSRTLRVEPIAVTFTQQPPDFSTGTIPGIFSVGVVGTQGFEPYTFTYSIDSEALDKSMAGVAIGAIPVTGLKPGEHVLYIRATTQDGKQTPVVKHTFTVK